MNYCNKQLLNGKIISYFLWKCELKKISNYPKETEFLIHNMQIISYLQVFLCTTFSLFKILHSSIPIYVASKLQLLSSHHSIGTRSQNDNLLIPHGTSLYSTSFPISTIHIWNSFPQYIRSCSRLETFKLFLLNYCWENGAS